MNPEVSAMMALRHEAHRRGNYLVVGSVSLIETAHGILRFPVKSGHPTGLTLGYVTDAERKPDAQKLIVLTPWEGVPDILEKTDKFCSACLSDCFVCGTKGVKSCEGVGCGGRGWTPGPFQDCTAPGCLKDTGKFLLSCEECGGRGQIEPHLKCAMCDGKGQMTCSWCKGNTRYSTGIKHGGTDYTLGRCDRCHGEQRDVMIKKQAIEQHVNAAFPDPKTGPIIAVGPILSVIVDLTEEMRESENTVIKMFDVKPDGAGDHLFLLLDSSSNPPWPYLIGGLVIERNSAALQASQVQGLPR
jgi:hypothetical protein